jgi:hypothetical protein
VGLKEYPAHRFFLIGNSIKIVVDPFDQEISYLALLAGIGQVSR